VTTRPLHIVSNIAVNNKNIEKNKGILIENIELENITNPSKGNEIKTTQRNIFEIKYLLLILNTIFYL